MPENEKMKLYRKWKKMIYRRVIEVVEVIILFKQDLRMYLIELKNNSKLFDFYTWLPNT